jgi:hypothetical protein
LRRNNRRLSRRLQRRRYFDAGRLGICKLWDAAGTVVGGNAAGIDLNLGKS